MPYDIINAFTGKESLGNPAAVYILTQQLPKEQLQKIASEISLPETSFIYKNLEEESENKEKDYLTFGVKNTVDIPISLVDKLRKNSKYLFATIDNL